MTHFSRVLLTISDFVNQMGQSAFISNIHPSKQYKYFLGHQKTPTFTMLIEAVAAHASMEEKMNPFLELDLKAGYGPHPSKNEQCRYENRTDQLLQPHRQA